MNESHITCLCRVCSGHIEFPVEGIGREVDCPHCGMTTVLYCPSSEPTKGKALFSELLKEHRDKQLPISKLGSVSKPESPMPRKPVKPSAPHPVASLKLPPKPTAPTALRGVTFGQGSAIIAILILGLFAVPFFSSLFNQISPHQRWEYAVVSVSDSSFDRKMREYGDAGWELVFARRASEGTYYPMFSYEMILKRPKKLH